MALNLGPHLLRLVEKKLIHGALALLTFEIDSHFVFEPGQFINMVCTVNKKDVKRSYSLSSPPSELPQITIYIRRIQQGLVTPNLFDLEEGSTLRMFGPYGHFLLDDSNNLALFIASGTGLGPYISMIKEMVKDDKNREVIVVHGVSYSKDLGFRKELEELEQQTKEKQKGFRLRYIPAVSRADEEPGWKGVRGRVEAFIKKGELEKITGKTFTPENTVVYACGHPEMIDHIIDIFEKKGFQKMKNIKFEKYWPNPKK